MHNIKLFDAHFHIIDPRFPLVANQGFVPETFTCADYLNLMQEFKLVGGVVVSGSFQAFDQTYLLAALKTLGPSFVGVTQLPETVSDQQLLELNRAGVRALRCNLKRGGNEQLRQLDSLARRVYEVAGWHIEFYVDSTELNRLFPTLVALPAVSFDHLGLSNAGFSTLLKLAERGVRIKATGFGRVDFDVRAALHDLNSANPNTLMFGTDLPSTRAARHFQDEDVAVIIETLGETQAIRVLYENALEFYHPLQTG